MPTPLTLPIPATDPRAPSHARADGATTTSTRGLAMVLRWARSSVLPYRLLSDVNARSLAKAAGCGVGVVVVMTVLAVATRSLALALLAGVGIVVVLAAGIGATVWWAGYRTSPRRDHHLLLARSGIATAAEVRRVAGEAAVRVKAPQVRPAHHAWSTAAGKTVAASEVAWLVGTSRTVPVWAGIEIPLYLLGPARSGKGYGVLTAAIMEAPGSVVTTSTRADNMEATIAARAETGPVYLFDPEGVSGRATTLRWNLLAGCEDPAVAQRRAAVLVSKTGLSGDNQVWATSAGGIVQCLLHAAAVSGRRVTDVHRWSTSPEVAREVEGLLERYSPGTSWSETIAAIQAEDAKMRANKWFGVETAFKALDVPSVRAVFDVDPDAAFDAEEFLRASGTLYLVSQWRKSDMTGGSVGAFFSLVLDDIAQAVRRLSQHPANSGRQDPPCTMVLDEIANIHPWPGLPLAAAAGSGEGLQVLVAFQSRSQARQAYGREVERSLWENSTALVLGASSDTADLKELSDLLGERTNQVRSTSWGQGGSVLTPTIQDSERERALISVDELRRLPEHVLLMVQGRARPMVVTTIPWPQRAWAPRVHASKAWHARNVSTGSGLAPTYERGTE